VIFNPSACVGFITPADFSDHHHAVAFRIVLEEFEQLDEVQSLDRIATDADAGGLTMPRDDVCQTAS
jgi:hypothetical protein